MTLKGVFEGENVETGFYKIAIGEFFLFHKLMSIIDQIVKWKLISVKD